MTLELSLSALVTALCLSLAWGARRSFVSVHLLPLGVLSVALPLVRLIFGGHPWLVSDETLVFAYGAVAVYAICVWFVAKLLRDRSLAHLAHWIGSVSEKELPIAEAIWVVAILWLVRVYQAVEYGVLVSGSANEEVILGIPYWLTSFNSIVSLLGLGSITLIAIAAARGSPRLWTIVVAELVWTFVSAGRREFLFLVLLVLWIAWQARLLRTKTLLAGVSVFVALLYIVTPVFLYGRDYNSELLATGMPPVSAFMTAFSQSWSECGFNLACSDRTNANVTGRGNAMEFMKSVVGSERGGSDLLLGMGFMYTLVWAVPGFLVSKPALMTEQYLQLNFGLPLHDDAISVPTLAYADFGILGCAIAGIALSAYSYYVAKYARRRRSMLILASISVGVLNHLWNIEGDPISYLTLVRDSLIIVTIAALTTFIYRAIRFGRLR